MIFLQWVHEHASVVQLLLGAGAEADAVDKFGKTCRHWEAQDGKNDVVRLLLAAGAAPNKADYDGACQLSPAAALSSISVGAQTAVEAHRLAYLNQSWVHTACIQVDEPSRSVSSCIRAAHVAHMHLQTCTGEYMLNTR
jgi:ankyrin repeat protein